MRRRAIFAAMTALALGATLVACAPENVDRIVPGTELTALLADPVTSLNPMVQGQNTAANENAGALLHASFWNREPDGSRTQNTFFGSIRVHSSDPLRVQYTVDGDARWSDGAPIDAADLLLTWAAGTTHRTDDETWWNTGAGPGRGLDLASSAPEVVDGGRGVILSYERPLADWQAAFDVPPVSAHGTVMLAYPGEYPDAAAAKAAFIDAVAEGDLEWLAPVARAFREEYVVHAGMPSEALLTSGAYLLDEVTPDGTAARLVADDAARWMPSATVERVNIEAVPDVAERIAAVAAGEADLAAAAATPSLVAAAPEGQSVKAGASFEHLDLQTAGGGIFDPMRYGGDEARALAVRRAFLMSIPTAELANEAALPRTSLTAPTPASTASPVPVDEPDVDAAASLLASAQVVAPAVRLLVPEGDERRAAEAALIAQRAGEAGFQVETLARADWADALDADPAAYDAALFAWDYDPTVRTALAAGFHTSAAQNLYGWSSDEVDGLISSIEGATDADVRADLMTELDSALAAEAWSVALYDVPVLTVWSDRVADVPPSATADGILAGYESWTLR